MTFQLTPNQQAALEVDGDVMVTAAAGSGKTRVLTMRILRAVLEQGADLRHVVAVTYTRRAADEIRMRVAAGLQERGRFDLIALLDQATIGTIHNLCGRIVRRHGALLGIDPGVRMLDETTCRWELRQAIRWACSELATVDSDVAMLRSRWRDDRIESIIIAAHSASQQRVDPRVTCVPQHGLTEDSDLGALDRIMQAALARYEFACRTHGGVDFDRMQRLALDLLSIDDVRLDIRSHVSRLLVDEFQDTNALQCAIIDAIGDACTFAVGDEFQSIYRFRAADVEVFRERRNSHHNVLAMPENFRSHPNILAVVNAIFTSAFGDHYQPVVAGRSTESDETNIAIPGIRVAIADAIDEARRIEASHVAARVVELCNTGVSAGDIALLFPRSSQASIYVDALRAAGIRTVQSSSRGYHRQDAVRDLVNLLSWINNPVDDRVTLGVLASPIFRVPPRVMLHLRRVAGAEGTIWSALCSCASDTDNAFHHHAAEIVAVHRRLATRAMRVSMPELVDQAIHTTRLASQAIAGPDGTRAYANLRKLVEIAASAHRDGVRQLPDLVGLLRAQISFNQQGEANIAEEGTDAVRIMTVHASKGLEFPHVFICDLGNFSSRPFDALLDDDGTAWMPRFDDASGEWVKPSRFIELETAERAEQADELTRLMYVAMTRAEQSLWMSAAVTWTSGKHQKAKQQGAIRWLLDALEWDIVADPGPHQHLNMPLMMQRIDSLAAEHQLEVVPGTGSAPDLTHEVYVPTLDRGPNLELDHPVEPVGSSQEASQRELLSSGERMHALIEASLMNLDTSGWNIDQSMQERMKALLESEIWQQLITAGARPEVSWHACVDGEMQSGRFDALVIDDAHWWIVDWKHSLAGSANGVWSVHGVQFDTYMKAALASGASHVRLTAVSLSDPTTTYEWSRTK